MIALRTLVERSDYKMRVLEDAYCCTCACCQSKARGGGWYPHGCRPPASILEARP
jgi:hypothetical protein